MIAKAKALSPRKIETQIKPETAVGTEKSSIYPERVSESPLNIPVQIRNTIKGIKTWAERKKSPRGMGSLIAVPKALARKVNAPDKVMTANNQGTRGRRCINSRGNKNPRITPAGVKTGRNCSSRLFTATAISAGFFLIPIVITIP
jgi:hypothetical protein